MQTIHLKPNRHKRVADGHRWIFAGEIAENLKNFKPGELVTVCESKGGIIGRGYINPHTLIAVRMLTFGDSEWNDEYLHHRIAQACEYRAEVCQNLEAYRLIYSEADALPGLIVDKYGDHLIVQSMTSGMEVLLPSVLAALEEIVSPKSIYIRSDSSFRKLEGLEPDIRQFMGETPEEIWFKEGELQLAAYPLDGHKTGFYLDQRQNRKLLEGLVNNKSILDLFCYTGAWSISSLKYGAKEAVAVDSSTKALQRAAGSFEKNGFSEQAKTMESPVADYLKHCRQTEQQFDVIILDPPALIKARSAFKAGVKAYESIHKSAMSVLADDGILVSCSCSHLLDNKDHLGIIGRTATIMGLDVRVIKTGSQPSDHPILPGHPESEYLNCYVLHCKQTKS